VIERAVRRVSLAEEKRGKRRGAREVSSGEGEGVWSRRVDQRSRASSRR